MEDMIPMIDKNVTAYSKNGLNGVFFKFFTFDKMLLAKLQTSTGTYDVCGCYDSMDILPYFKHLIIINLLFIKKQILYKIFFQFI